MAIHDETNPVSNSSTQTHSDARQAAYVAFLHRVPFALDALTLGFLPGFREDCTYQQSQFDTLECPVGMLDNDFRNPDLDRYVNRVLEYEPDVGIIGDAYDAAEAQSYVDAIRELQGSLPETEFIIVPKCRAAIEAIPDDIVLGYSRGYADTLAHEFSDPVDWRGRRVHILGGSPPKQLKVVEQLTQPTLTGDPQLISSALTGMVCIAARSSANFGQPTAGTIVVATPTTLRSGRRSAIASAGSKNSGRPRASGPTRHHNRMQPNSAIPGPHQAISKARRVPSAVRTCGRPSEVRMSPSTIRVTSVGTAAMSAISSTGIETISRRSPASGVSTSRQGDATFCFSRPEGRGLKRESSKQVIL